EKFRLSFCHFRRGFLGAALGNERLDQVRSRARNRNVSGWKHAHPNRQWRAQILSPRSRIAEPDLGIAEIPQRVRGVLVLVAERLAAQVERFGERGARAGAVSETEARHAQV